MLPIVIISILLGSMATTLAAVPLLPMTVFGDVYVDDVLAGTGFNVYAKHGTTIVGETTTNADGYYILSITEDSGLDDGDPIDFYVGTTDTGETVPMEYGNMPLVQDLYVAGGVPDPDTGTLLITTTPSGGEVFVDTVSWGLAPQFRVVDVGTYAVSFGDVALYDTPDDDVAVVEDGETTIINGLYELIPVDDPDDDDDDDPDITPGVGFSIDYVSEDEVVYNDELSVYGSGVTAGADVSVYWDLLTSDGLLNTTDGNPDGTFDLTIDIPSDLAGNHYLWARDESTG
ncbi:hypothetical protein LCGC14_3126750, partial [marine sediment metagenome]